MARIISLAGNKLRLAHIKLAGFKSFVDPTHIALPGQLVGIVGPNGCGKSNVIDALRWVLGESRASALRGESMQDVIFNGAGTHKPVSRASVELVFDNSLGKAAGQWSTYAEISIKRVLQRNGDSNYYINNQHVRRKDITDIFLGTGLGARAYAIIEQGMISRIIEAKPEELRVFLEEAAGVSKYRDRRRETELRLGDTRDNLLRVSDIQQELEKQLGHLTEQAAVATQYRDLESRRDTTQRLLSLVNKQDAEARRARLALQVEKTKTDLEAEVATLRALEAQLEAARAAHFSLSDALHAKQGELYASNAEVSRLEQQLTFLIEQRNRLGQQIAIGERQLAQQQTQLKGLQGLLEHWQQQQQIAGERVASAENVATAESSNLPQAEAEATAAREQHRLAQREQMLLQQQVQLADTQRQHAQTNQQQLNNRRARLSAEKENLPAADVTTLDLAQQSLLVLQTEVALRQQQLAEWQTQLPLADEERRRQRAATQQMERQLAQVEARLQALEQLQAKLDTDKNMQAWLAKYQLEKAPRLWQSIRIEAGWEDALEAVLRERLNALALPNLESISTWESLPPAKLAVFAVADKSSPNSSNNGSLSPLAKLVTCQDQAAAQVVQDWLANVFAAADVSMALAQRDQLPAGACLVTPQGVVLSAHGVMFHAPDNQVHGLLARQREIETLRLDAQQQRQALELSRSQTAQAESKYVELENKIGPLRAAGSELQQRQHQVQLQILKLTQANDRSRERGGQIAQELQELDERLANEQQQLSQLDLQMSATREAMTVAQLEVERTLQRVNAVEKIVREQREHSQKSHQTLQEAGFFAKTCADKITDLTQNVAQNTTTLLELETALAYSRDEQLRLTDAEIQAQLQHVLGQRKAHEHALVLARNELENATSGLNQLDQNRLASEHKLNPLRDKVGDLALKEQEARLQTEHWAEQLEGVDEAPLIALLDGVKLGGLQYELARLNNDIVALGAVNLAALEELQVAQERSGYLDAQAKDLYAAMNTLEDAIRRIDKESRDLLMATYDQVNLHLAELFPILFGGGEARLVLTGTEILDSGMQVMAQPPGKKNASIHLLSGGEKALTAISLVFALFQLNPAPFCLLDEVDAPLDDTNTERLCNLIKKMALKTQFIFISHNKITMELAQQLIGVTMQERGVSKVVSVDIEEALKLSEVLVTI